MTDADFLKAMHIKPESAPTVERENGCETDLTPNVLIDLDEDDLRAAAINWCSQARAQYEENQVLRTDVRNLQGSVVYWWEAADKAEKNNRVLRESNRQWRNTSGFLICVSGLLLIALIAVSGGLL